MSEQDDLDRLERQLDAAFSATRPRRGFEDELWGELSARRQRRQRRLAWLDRGVALGAAAGVAVVLVAGVVGISRIPHGGFSGGASTATSGASRPNEGAGAGTPPLAPGSLAGPSSAIDRAALPFGRLPAPAGAGVPQAIVSGTKSALPSGSVRVIVDSGVTPAAPQSVGVYRYDIGSGPAEGAILEPGAVPPGEAVGTYPARPAADALAEATARASGSGSGASQGELRLTAARLVYVAVVADGAGYLEPAYLYSGTLTTGGTTVPAQLLLPALPASALR